MREKKKKSLDNEGQFDLTNFLVFTQYYYVLYMYMYYIDLKLDFSQ